MDFRTSFAKLMRRVGFLETTKSQIILGIIALIVAICCGFLAFLFFYPETPRSGDQLFKDAILNPIPKSVIILDSHDPSPNLESDLCLHFKISPEDFKKILASRTWEIVSEDSFPGAECFDWIDPPPSLGSKVITYSYVPEKNDIEVMYTNAEMNEVYYFYRDGNLP